MSKRPLQLSSGSNSASLKRANTTKPSPEPSNLDTSGPCFVKLLAECGVLSSGSSWALKVSPNDLRSSIASLLKELQKPSLNVDLQKVVVEDMETVLGDQAILNR